MKHSRRHFIQKITASALTIPVVSSYATQQAFQPNKKKSTKKLRVALMGLGGYARLVADGIQESEHAVVTGLISGTPEKLVDWGAQYQVPEESRYNYENFDAIKDNPEIDAVYIITPNAQHHGQALRVAKAGKHVICEKPMAISVKEGQEMVDACEKAGVKLLVGYRMRFEANTLAAIDKRNNDDFGRILFFQGMSGFRIGDPNQWRLQLDLAGGGAMMDTGIYAVNGARYMVGEEPIWVTAQETKTDPVKFKEGIDETIMFQFGFPSGAVASCLSSYNMNHLSRFFLNGEKGFVELIPATSYGPIKGWTNEGDLGLPHVNHQAKQMDEMADIIVDGKTSPLPVDGKVGLQDLIIMEAIYRACETGEKQMLDLG
ncbi:MAG: Gfo/Idh/MocA family protein [Sphingobacterium sp.]